MRRRGRARRGRSPCCRPAARCRARRWPPFFGEVRIGALQPGPGLLPFECSALSKRRIWLRLIVSPSLASSAWSRSKVQWQVGGTLPLRRFGGQAARLGDHAAVRILGVGARAARARRVSSPSTPSASKRSIHCRTPSRSAALLGNRRHAEAGRRQRDDARPPRQPHRYRLRPGESLNLLLFLVR